MIDHKLALELKEAGFPLEEITGRELESWEKRLRIIPPEDVPNLGIVIIDSRLYRLPTLSELIEACGDKFIELRKQTTNWLVLGRTDDEMCDKGMMHDAMPVNAVEDTPEEAVARLWLALNKKE